MFTPSIRTVLVSASAISLVMSYAAPGFAQIMAKSDSTRQNERSLPYQDSTFRGTIGTTYTNSKEDWPREVSAPKGAPNVLLIMTDDVGFSSDSTFGGPVPSPNLNRLAASGIRYNNFNTTAVCSATRAALLTGRNHHAVGAGTIVDLAAGYPGYSSVIPKSAASIAEVLRQNGYNTAMFGKHHNIPEWEMSPSGPFDHWPTGLGFEYFYGFILGATDQWNPVLYRNTLPAKSDIKPGETLDSALADNAIHWIHQQKANTPDKPFFAYMATGTGHSPHQAPKAWVDKFKGQFDQGWDAVRQQSFDRQKKLGMIPQDTVLTPRPDGLPAWDSLSADQRRVNARYMEVAAGMLAYQDAQIGRLVDELKRMGQFDNTLIMFIEGDNGASGEGGIQGTRGGFTRGNMKPADALKEDLKGIHLLGTDHSYQNYPAGWAWALNAPFQWMKQVASHFGGLRDGMIVSWPGHTDASDRIRQQFTHVTDIYPTILEAAGVQTPANVNGIRQQPVNGTSFIYSLTNATAAERHTQQYFEMFANRGMYKDGWFANTTVRRLPWTLINPGGDAFKDYNWELYDLKVDFSQSNNLANKYPERLAAMKKLWLDEAKANRVLPLTDNLGRTIGAGAGIDQYMPTRTHYDYWGKDIVVGQHMAPSFANRSFTITANITLPAANTTGVILARGSWFGGWSFYLKDGHPTVLQTLTEQPDDAIKIVSPVTLPAGNAKLTYRFSYDEVGKKGGNMCIAINDVQATCGKINAMRSHDAGQGETFDIGKDTGTPVTTDYASVPIFPGTIESVSVDTAR